MKSLVAHELQLHRLHICGQASLAPLRKLLPQQPCAVEPHSLPAAQLAAAAAALAARHLEEASCGQSAEAAVRISFDLEARDVCIGGRVGVGPAVKVPLVRAELAHSAAGSRGHALAVVPLAETAAQGEEAELGVWLFTFPADAAALLETLDALSCLGAVRASLSEAFSLSARVLGSGKYASVYLAESRSAGGAAAVKMTAEPGSKADERLPVEMQLLLVAQGHCHVVRFLGLFRTAGRSGEGATQWALALQICHRGSLLNLITVRGPRGEAAAGELMSGVLSGITHLHKQGVVHRDIKASNVLLTRHGRAVITDFGLAAHLFDGTAMAKPCGTPGYAAPEIVLPPHRHDSKVDVFAFGVSLFFVLSGVLPFKGAGAEETCKDVVRCEVDMEASPALAKASEAARALLLALLARAPEQRPAAGAALGDAWFAQDAVAEEAAPRRSGRPRTSAWAAEGKAAARGGDAGAGSGRRAPARATWAAPAPAALPRSPRAPPRSPRRSGGPAASKGPAGAALWDAWRLLRSVRLAAERVRRSALWFGSERSSPSAGERRAVSAGGCPRRPSDGELEGAAATATFQSESERETAGGSARRFTAEAAAGGQELWAVVPGVASSV